MSVKVKIVEKILPDGVPWRPVETRQPAVRVRGSARVANPDTEPIPELPAGRKPQVYPNPCYSLNLIYESLS